MKFKLLLLGILLLAFVLRFYQLGTNPPSLDWDEASMGYNAYSILHTGRDEYGNFLPLSIRSFDDYKPALLTYLMVPSIKVFGLNEYAVRLPSALFGIIGVWLTYLLVLELFKTTDKKEQNNSKYLALLSAFFLAISPWHLQFSRTAFEGDIGLTFFLAGFVTLLFGLKKPFWWIISSLCFVFSMYSYHSFRLIIPLFFIIFAVAYYKTIIKEKIIASVALLLFLLLCLPIATSTFSPAQGASARLSMVTVFGDSGSLKQSIGELQYDTQKGDKLGEFLHNRRFVYVITIMQGYFSHFNPDFLLFHGDGGNQHHAVNMGMIYLWDLPFILLGLFYLCHNPTRKKFLIVSLFFLAPIPSAIATDPPHAVRAIAMIPGFQIFTAVGCLTSWLWIKNKKKPMMSIGIILTLLLLLLNVTYFLHQYFIHTPIEYANAWQYGNKQAVLYAKTHENEFDHIVMTYRYDQPYIYYLFYNKIDPTEYQSEWMNQESRSYQRMDRTIGKYEFHNIDWGQDSKMKNTLFIGTPDEIPGSVKKDTVISNPDGTPAFIITHT